MAEVVFFGDTPAAARTWLNPRMAPIKTSTEVPATRPDELIKVSLTGGSDPTVATEWSQLTFECWARDSARALRICRLVKAYVKAMAGETINGIFINKVRTVGNPASFPDPQTNLPRYQYTAELNCRYVPLGDD